MTAPVTTEEFRVNTVGWSQRAPDIAVLENGNLVFTWAGQPASGQESEDTVHVKIFDGSGNLVESEFWATGYVYLEQRDPELIPLTNGGFGVEYVEWNIFGPFPTSSIYKTRDWFDAAGQTTESPIPVDRAMLNIESSTTILSDTSFANFSTVGGWNNFTGLRDDVELVVVTAGAQDNPRNETRTTIDDDFTPIPVSATLANETAIVAWNSTPQDYQNINVKAKIFDERGAVIIDNLVLAPGWLGDFKIEALTNGGFILFWNSLDYETEEYISDVYAKVFDATGAVVTDTFLVNTVQGGIQRDAEVTALDGGGFVVTWVDGSLDMGDTSGTSIKAKVFTAQGDIVVDEFLVNDQTFGDQNDPAITSTQDNGFAITWVTDGGTDGEITTIKAKIFASSEFDPIADGTDEADTLIGTENNNTLRGLGGDDILHGLAGSDILDGGEGEDTAVFEGSQDHRIDLGLNWSQETGAGYDRLISIESIRTGDGHDVLIGNSGINHLDGQGGDDWLFGDDTSAAYFGTAAANQVYRLYQASLDRAPDFTGHYNWTARIASGERTLEEVAGGFVGSPEFAARFPAASNTDFVTLLYNNVLGTQPDAAGLARWTGELDGGASRASVVLGFANSPQFTNETNAAATQFVKQSLVTTWSDDVFRLYQATLDRSPDQQGMDRWTGELADGTSKLEQVAAGFVGSPEFTSRFPASSNTDFVTLLYNNVLGTQPDAAGLARWTGELDDGASRASVVLGFSQSPQFTAQTANAVKSWMRDQGVHDRIEPGAGMNTVAGGQYADVFEFTAGQTGTTTVMDFEDWDFLQLNGFGYADLAAAKAQMSQTAGDLTFADQGVTVVLKDTMLADIQVDDFVDTFAVA